MADGELASLPDLEELKSNRRWSSFLKEFPILLSLEEIFEYSNLMTSVLLMVLVHISWGWSKADVMGKEKKQLIVSFGLEEIDSTIKLFIWETWSCLHKHWLILITFIYYKIYIKRITNTRNNDLFSP